MLHFKQESGIRGGFRVEHLEADVPTPEGTAVVGIDSGAGCGNPLVYINFKLPGKDTVRFTCDMREVLRKVIEDHLMEPSPSSAVVEMPSSLRTIRQSLA